MKAGSRQQAAGNSRKVEVLIFAVCALLFACCTFAQAQQPRKPYRIGYLSVVTPAAETSRLEAFRKGLRDFGYVEGQNIVIEPRYTEGKLDRLAEFVAELVRLKVDVIVTGGSPGTEAAQRATKTIPLVMTLVGDPVPRFVTSLAKPGGNITGLTQVSPQLTGKRLELLKESVPKISHVAVVGDQAALAPQQQVSDVLQEAKLAADGLGVKVTSFTVRGPNPDLEGIFKTIKSERAEALIISPGPVLRYHRKRFLDLTAQSRLPAMYGDSEWIQAGGLMSYGTDYADLHRRAAAYVDKILKEVRPSDLPIEQPTKFELAINLKTAKQIGVTIPPNVLARADRVIK